MMAAPASGSSGTSSLLGAGAIGGGLGGLLGGDDD